MNRLLVAPDFSARSGRALRRAALITRKVGTSFTLAHQVDADRPGRLIESDRTAASDLLSDTARTLRDVAGGHHFIETPVGKTLIAYALPRL